MRPSIMDMIEQIGALLGLAAFLGLAVLVLLYFQQARDVRRLREWAGRAPERAEAAAEEAIAAGDQGGGAGAGGGAAAPGKEATLRERLAARLRLPANLRERLPAIPYLAIIAVGVVLVAVGVGFATGGFGLLGDEEADGGKRDKPLPPGKVEVAVLNGTAAAGDDRRARARRRGWRGRSSPTASRSARLATSRAPRTAS